MYLCRQIILQKDSHQEADEGLIREKSMPYGCST
jgi:hypothetical protein